MVWRILVLEFDFNLVVQSTSLRKQ